jgi:hypothetical protein
MHRQPGPGELNELVIECVRCCSADAPYYFSSRGVDRKTAAGRGEPRREPSSNSTELGLQLSGVDGILDFLRVGDLRRRVADEQRRPTDDDRGPGHP